MTPMVRHFKKYVNRKFYDLDRGRYASLLDVGKVVASEEEFETLTRALYERTK